MAFRINHNPHLLTGIQAGETVAARLAGEYILGEARRTVPIEEGTLERSGVVDGTDDHHIAVRFNTPYAARQHEELTYRHDPGRRAKYLELAVEENKPKIQAIVAEQLRRAVP